MNSYVNTYRKSSTFQRHPGANSMSLLAGLLPFTSEMALFEFPFNELLVIFQFYSSMNGENRFVQIMFLSFTKDKRLLKKNPLSCLSIKH